MEHSLSCKAMIVISAFVYFLSRSPPSINAAPMGFSRLDGDFLISQSSQEACVNQRSIWDIIWSCLATVFACCWVSVHPNMPALTDGKWKIACHRLELMFWAVIAPEMIIMWALRQWYGARALANIYEDFGWTQTHGYFIQMGGFMLYKFDAPQGVLSPEKMKELLTKGEIKFPKITEKQIQDRSKGDGLAKALLVLQTMWFIAQCIARKAQGLDTTEIELVTLAFAVLNAAMYFVWWNKPLDAQSHEIVHLLDPPLHPSRVKGSTIEQDSQPQIVLTYMGCAVSWFRDLLLGLTLFCSSTLPLHVWRTIKSLSWHQVAAVLLFPFALVGMALRRLGDMRESQHSNSIPNGCMKVPTFYALNTSEKEFPSTFLIAYLLAIIFGAVHCAGWFFHFPSHIEAMVWRVCSVIIVSVPMFTFIWFLIDLAHNQIPKPIKRLIALLVLLALPAYILSRLGLLIASLIALRDLTPGAYAQVKWTSFLPHI